MCFLPIAVDIMLMRVYDWCIRSLKQKKGQKMIKKQVDAVLDSTMDRKTFLKNVGIAVLALAGVTTMLSTLGQFNRSGNKQTGGGYGNTSYGR